MIAGVIAAVLHEPPHVIETWSPEKATFWFEVAIKTRNILNGHHEEGA